MNFSLFCHSLYDPPHSTGELGTRIVFHRLGCRADCGVGVAFPEVVACYASIYQVFSPTRLLFSCEQGGGFSCCASTFCVPRRHLASLLVVLEAAGRCMFFTVFRPSSLMLAAAFPAASPRSFSRPIIRVRGEANGMHTNSFQIVSISVIGRPRCLSSPSCQGWFYCTMHIAREDLQHIMSGKCG